MHFETVAIAKYLVTGQGYWFDWYGTITPQPTAILTPLYTYFIAIFLILFDEPARFIYLSQAFINALIVIPGYFLGRFLGGAKNGIVLALVLALFPEVAFMPNRMVAETLTIVMVFACIYLYLKYKSRMLTDGKTAGFAILGLLLGITTLAKANTAFLFLSCFIGIIFVNAKKMVWLKAAFLLGLTFTITISPWFIRNYIVFDKPVFRTMYGFNLWRGNHPGASGTGRLASGAISEASLEKEYLDYIEENHPDTELGIDNFYKQEAYKFIKQDPSRYLWLTAKRIVYFLIIDPTHPYTKNIIYLGGYLFAVIFGIWGGIILKRKRQLDRIYILSPLIYMVFYVPVIILPRYRLMLVWILLILASVSLTHLLAKLGWFRSMFPDDYSQSLKT